MRNRVSSFALFVAIVLIVAMQPSRLAATNVCGTISSSTTWTRQNSPYIVTCNVIVAGPNSPVLTINSLVSVRFNASTSLRIGESQPGGIVAVGTSAERITFTSNSLQPAAGDWSGIILGSQILSNSNISWSDIRYAFKGIQVKSSSVVLDHDSITNTASSGLYLFNSSSPNVLQASFSNNLQYAASTSQPAIPVRVPYGWWNSASGPSCSGCPGTGEAVGSGILYEPWLVGTPSGQHYFKTFSMPYRTFNPEIGMYAELSFSTSSASSQHWTVTFFNSLDQQVRVYTGTGQNGSVQWDGKNGSGILQPAGTYTYKLESADNGGNVATPAKGYVIIDSSLHLTIEQFSVSNRYFSPNGDGIQDTTAVTASMEPFENPSWTLRIKNQAGAAVRTVTGMGKAVSYTWDGKNDSGAPQPEGQYTVEITAQASGAQAVVSTSVFIDPGLPSAVITDPPDGATVSNVYEGSGNKEIIGTADDPNFDHWTLRYCLMPTCNWVSIPSPPGTNPPGVQNGLLGVWSTDTLGNGTYKLELAVQDMAGNSSVATNTVTLGNFHYLGADVREFNPLTGGSVTYTTVVPFTLDETVRIYSDPGQVDLICTLFSGQRTADAYIDIWTGRRTSGPNACSGDLAPDGPYFVVITASADGHTLVVDLSNENVEGSDEHYDFSVSADPFDNQQYVLSYSLPSPARVRVIFDDFSILGCTETGECLDNAGHFFDDCANAADFPNQFCIIDNEYMESGLHTLRLAGVDRFGVYHPIVTAETVVAHMGPPPPDYGTCSVSQYTHQITCEANGGIWTPNLAGGFLKNAFLLYGSKPTIQNLQIDTRASDNNAISTYFNPANPEFFLNPQSDSSKLRVTFELGLYQVGEIAEVTTTFQNQECILEGFPASDCVLRTIQQNSGSGNVFVNWDGLTDSGKWAAPAQYTVTVKVRDALGNEVSQQLLATLQY